MIFVYLIISLVQSFEYSQLLNKTWENIEKELVNGSLPGGRLSIEDISNLFDNLSQQSKYVYSQSIGQSYLNNTINSYIICDEYLQNKPSILITSLHHAREVASLQMNIYLFLNILWKVEHQKDKFYQNFIKNNCIIIVPFVNIDGYIDVSNKLNQGDPHPFTRKNLNKTVTCKKNDSDGGIDLNRNYGYQFAHDNIGSASDPCDETYRGSTPFSEKETQAIKSIVETNNIKMAMNLHCFGNLWIIPYSYADEELDADSVPYKIYEDYKNNGEFTGKYMYGHAKQLVGYTANGEAADWMLSQNIIAISPELGQERYSAFMNNFYLDKNQTLSLFQQEKQPLFHFINYLPFQPIIIEMNQINQEQDESQKITQQKIEIKCKNIGISPPNNNTLNIETNFLILNAFYQYENSNDQVPANFTQNVIYITDFPPLSIVTFYLIIDTSDSKQYKKKNNEITVYFDLYQNENIKKTIQFSFNNQIHKKNFSQHLLYLLYIGIAAIIVIVVLCRKDLRNYSQDRQHRLTELTEQKPESIQLNIQV